MTRLALALVLLVGACGPSTDRPTCRYDGDLVAPTARAVCEERP